MYVACVFARSVPVSFVARWIAPAVLFLCAAHPALAVNKCVHPKTGAVQYTDGDCEAGSTSQAVTLTPNATQGEAPERPVHIRAAIAARRPEVGMTWGDLQRAMGKPDKVNAAQYGAETKDQLIYYTDSRTIYVYLTNGMVTAIQNTDGGRPKVAQPSYAAPGKPCPSPRDIRNIEFEISKLENRDRPQVLAELHRQLGAARNCGR